jgi:BirA family biotin operon repressor/biotin-[acetyl-CoA-carboxylase] ligase
MTEPGSHVPLSVDSIRAARAGALIGSCLQYFESVDSTNTLAHQLAREGTPDGTVVIAETQVKGRGRLGRTWVSPAYRNLSLSVVLRPDMSPTEAPQIGLVAGLAVAETVREWGPRALIKWPNDVLIDGRKVAGILTEMESGDGRVQVVVVGIGVNLNSESADFPPELRDRAVGLCGAAGALIDRSAFATRLLARFEERYEMLLRDGFAAIRPLWEGLSCLTGRHVRIDGGGDRYEGVVTGLGTDGTLRLRSAAGQETRVLADDVTVVNGYGESGQDKKAEG